MSTFDLNLVSDLIKTLFFLFYISSFFQNFIVQVVWVVRHWKLTKRRPIHFSQIQRDWIGNFTIILLLCSQLEQSLEKAWNCQSNSIIFYTFKLVSFFEKYKHKVEIVLLIYTGSSIIPVTQLLLIFLKYKVPVIFLPYFGLTAFPYQPSCSKFHKFHWIISFQV